MHSMAEQPCTHHHVLIGIYLERAACAHGGNLLHELNTEHVAQALHVRWEARRIFAAKYVLKERLIVQLIAASRQSFVCYPSARLDLTQIHPPSAISAKAQLYCLQKVRQHVEANQRR